MTDKEMIVEMLTRAGIVYEVEEQYSCQTRWETPNTGGDDAITVKGGYDGCYSTFRFKSDGRLVSLAAFE